jgi:hypothetical protein
MSLPGTVREEMRQRLWRIAESINWAYLSPSAKARYYEEWTRHPDIGGVLEHYMDRGKVRVYLKDTILKEYSRKMIADEVRPLRALGVATPVGIAERYIKPHGVRLSDGRVASWGRADDWKLVLLAVYERASAGHGVQAFGAVLLNTTGRFDEPDVQSMIEVAAVRLGIRQVIWLRT